MSGMEPLAALGLACNIMQLLSFGGEAISLCRKVYKTGEIDPSLKDYSNQTAKICESLNDNLTQQQPDLGPDASALQQRAITCKAAADKLNHELGLLTPTGGAGRWRSFTASIKAIRHKQHLSELEKDLNNLKSNLDTQLLVKIFDLVDPSKLKTEILADSKGLLATTLQQVASGQKDLSQQIVKALEDAQDRFNAEYLRNQRKIDQQIAATARGFQDERARAQQEKRENEQRQDWDHLLKSLHFGARTERVNMIRQEYSDTCRWIFGSSTQDELADYHKHKKAYPESHPQTWPCFTTWLQSKSQPIYWISGKPGSGKSTLMKFIASDDSPTRDSLKQWQPGVEVLSHYFWLAGSSMQNNIKGLLCSLVYQVLSRDMSSALAFLESNSDIKRKSSTMDWDPTELRRILINLAHQPGKAFCIIIDGLDELSPQESPRDLIDIITELRGPQVKLCLSSRPEPAMKMYLGHYPTLPMHAFIRDDIRRYAEGILNRAMSHRNDAFEVTRLVNEISSEADGVFLWAVLVARSLERGIEKGDSLQLLEERLHQIPKSLSELYSTMWQRLGDNPETYQKGFSHFMNLMLLAEGATYLDHEGKVTVFELMAGTNATFLDKYLNQDYQVSQEKLKMLCHDTRNSIEAWSAGLLMVTISPDSNPDSHSEHTFLKDYGDTGPYRDLAFYAHMVVDYVHRTARDFLLEEVEGQKLWKRIDVSREDLEARLVKATLMKYQLWNFNSAVSRDINHFFNSIDRSEGSRGATYVAQKTLPDIERAFCKGSPECVWFKTKLYKHKKLQISFLELAAHHGFCDYVFRRVQEMQQTGQLEAHDYASLLYALCSKRIGHSITEGVPFAPRERLIQSLLSSGLLDCAKIRFSTDFGLSGSLLLTYLVSILESYCFFDRLEEAVATLTFLSKQAPSIQNVYVQLVVSFSCLPDGITWFSWGIQNPRSLFDENVRALVVMRVNVPYLLMVINSRIHASLCVPGILSKEEEPSAQAILIGVSKYKWGIMDHYEIESEEDSRKITEYVTTLLPCRHGSDQGETRKIETTREREFGKILQQIASKTPSLNVKADGTCDEKEALNRLERIDAAVNKFLSEKDTQVLPPWW